MSDLNWLPAELQMARKTIESLQRQVDIYGAELDAAAEVLQQVHPIGKIKGIGRREVATALRQLFPKSTSKSQLIK